MKIKRLILDNFGPFPSYELEFPADSRAFVLITGKNNAGKTSLLRALRLVDGALKLANGSSRTIDKPLRKIDIKDINIRRLVHGFQGGIATITAILDTGREIEVRVDGSNEHVSCNLPTRTPESVKSLFGFMPPLGQLPEEEAKVNKDYVLRYINTTLAPQHLRNQIYQLLSHPQRDRLKRVIYETWNEVTLGDVYHDTASNMLYCPYTEGQTTGEISLAGQGFQIWLQLMTNLIRLSDCSTIVLDEPEIFLHPEKQRKMVNTFREHFDGSMIIATHSPELMNEVDFSHILCIQREVSTPKIVSTKNRDLLEGIRAQIGSSFNLIASQFEDVERLIASENIQDYETITQIASQSGLSLRTHNIPISGLTKWEDCVQYKTAHKMFFGKEVPMSLLLDRDFYPKDFLEKIDKELSKHGIRTVFTPGHEIENIFLQQAFLLAILPVSVHPELTELLNRIYDEAHEDTLFKYVEGQKKYSPKDKGKEFHTIYEELKPTFDSTWGDSSRRHTLPQGKQILVTIRQFAKDKANITLSTAFLIQKLVETHNKEAFGLSSEIYGKPIGLAIGPNL